MRTSGLRHLFRAKAIANLKFILEKNTFTSTIRKPSDFQFDEGRDEQESILNDREGQPAI